jgi:hypothetical protein
MRKIRELVKDWASLSSGGAFAPGQPAPEDLNVKVAEVGPVVNEYVACKCFYLGQPNTFDLLMEDQGTAERTAAVIGQHIGETLLAIGELEVEAT